MENRKTVGIIVGRFQVPELHEGHLKLLTDVRETMDDFFVFLGSTETKGLTIHDPLPYAARKDMFVSHAIRRDHIFEIIDVGYWEKWVKILDEKIKCLIFLGLIPEDARILICGSRDSVTTRYKQSGGIYDVYEIATHGEFSGTEARKNFIETFDPTEERWSKEKREICIWAVNNMK